MRKRPGRRPSGRPVRVGDQIQRELSDLLLREVRDPRVSMVTLTAVEVSADCAHATVYFTCLEPQQVEAALAGLRSAAGFLRSGIARRIKMHVAPELKFEYDASIERGDRLARLIDEATGRRTR